jgi:hypothetical protein
MYALNSGKFGSNRLVALFLLRNNCLHGLESHRRHKVDALVKQILVIGFPLQYKVVTVQIIDRHPKIDLGRADGFRHIEIHSKQNLPLIVYQFTTKKIYL